MKILEIEKLDEGRYLVTSGACPTCSCAEKIEITGYELFQYHQGALAQEVLSRFSPAIREKFISGYCGDHFQEAMFGVSS